MEKKKKKPETCNVLHVTELANQELVHYVAQRDSNKGLKLHVNHVIKENEHYGQSWVEVEKQASLHQYF